ncbi:hypothetical protein XM38_008470 [Halomicronema hongdechloris C2206]|uniref:PIN domain-containing protein n=1 Tax=Halomicronema hongdechloris C2206 TaxID=1641165 RepID=A0A1Z3HII6_9CYAN|nr:PIN domain-containing protein [Halomicronema hongdechloris]ASC69917.1 hypothetical protein XM38_008470 [Halomicronema hongdechloris C2206]
MIGLDTNILVRYLTRDDEQQWQQAADLIQQNQPCFIANIVLCELVWVLRGANYRFQKKLSAFWRPCSIVLRLNLKTVQLWIKPSSDTNRAKQTSLTI